MNEQSQTQRIANKRFEKNIRLFKILGGITAILAVGRVIMNPEIFSGTWSIMDFGITLMPIYFFFEYRRKAKNWGGQFIEWSDNEVSFKTRKNKETSISTNSITNIEIKLDEIIIETSDRGELSIVVEDFTEYSDRMAIKNNFAELKKKLSLT